MEQEPKKGLTPEWLAVQGVCAFGGYKMVEAMCSAINFTGTGTFASSSPLLSGLGSVVGASWFVPLGFSLMVIPLLIKLAGFIRRKFILKASDFPTDGWYQEYVRQLADSNRQDTL